MCLPGSIRFGAAPMSVGEVADDWVIGGGAAVGLGFDGDTKSDRARMLPKPSTAATAHALFRAVCHFRRANTLSTRITRTKTSSAAIIPKAGVEAKKRYTQPSRNTCSYQCA